jgi:ABC-2 type transport system permease protein
MMVVWLAVVNEAGPITGWGRDEFISYYIGAAIVHQLTFSWLVWEWDDEIRTGSLSVKLLKPIDPIHHAISEHLGWKIFFVLFLVPVVAGIAWLSPAIQYPLTIERLVAFIVSGASGFLVSIFMATAFGMVSFWSTQSANLYSLWYGMGQFLSGWIAPLELFPAGLRQLAYWLPFRSILGFPVEILMGRLSWTDIWFGFGVTAMWIVIFFMAYRILWRLGLRRYEAVGA